MARLLVLGAVLALLTAPGHAAERPIAATVHRLDTAARAVIEALPLPDPKPPQCTALLSPAAYELIVEFETGGRALYRARYTRPVWPGYQSGVTIGIGYDLGHATAAVIRTDWTDHPQRPALPEASGITGPAAKPVARAMHHVVTPLPLAEAVFTCTSVIEYWRRTRRAFGDGFLALPRNAQGALVSLVYNRGGAMQGRRRVEMRRIRDTCIPRHDTACIADQLRAMTRLWAGSAIAAGMTRRREAEAALALTPDRSLP